MTLRALIIAGALALGATACTSWPEDGRGGFAERRAVSEPRLEALMMRFERQLERGAGHRVAGLVAETRMQMIRAQRHHAAGYTDELDDDCVRISHLISQIDHHLDGR